MSSTSHRSGRSVAICALALLALAACSGDTGAQGPAGETGATGATGPQGPAGPAGPSSFATVSGTVSDYFGNKVAGALVSSTVGRDTMKATADADGAYTLSLPAGSRTLSATATGYAAFSQALETVPAKAHTLHFKLNPMADAAVTAVRTDTATPVVPGTRIKLQAKALVFAPALQGKPAVYRWSVASGPEHTTFDDNTSATPVVTLAAPFDFKKFLVENFATPLYKVNSDEPSVNIDRYQPVPISYEAALSKGNTTTLKVEVTIGNQTFSNTLAVPATIPAAPSTGLTNVPIKQPVVLQGQYPFKDTNGAYVFEPRTTWNWQVSGPDGAVDVYDKDTAYPHFIPTAEGKYVVNEGGTKRFEMVAGKYTGSMTGVGTPDRLCTYCHKDTANIAENKFKDWLTSGHSRVIYAGIAEPLPDGHYSATCTPCHTVGSGAKGSGGFADQAAKDNPDYAMLQGDANAEEDFWALYPNSAALAGIQCENCHGPQTDAHMSKGNAPAPYAVSARMTYSSNICATCHARAPTHGRFPQWTESAHGNFSTFTYNANADGTLSTGCAVCHSAQGFKAFRAALPTANGDRNKAVLAADLRITNAQPITCATCHDAHAAGEAGVVEAGNLAKVGPVDGETYMLPSGFKAVGVGKGALCITCHNSRQGIFTLPDKTKTPSLHEDGDTNFGTLTSYGAPHEAAQGDVLMGRNAYWLGANRYNSPTTRSKHSYITDTCITCHMQLTDPHPRLGRAGQMRHDFKATPDVCNQCHTSYSTESMQAAFDDKLVEVKAAVGQAILRLRYNDAIPAGTRAVLVANRSGMVDVTTSVEGKVTTQRWFIGNKTGQDAFLTDPNNGGLVQGCTMVDAISANCDGYLKDAPGVTAIGSTATQDATVAANGINGVIAKALWNTVLVQDDASRGIHNPSFEFEVMQAVLQHVTGTTAFTK